MKKFTLLLLSGLFLLACDKDYNASKQAYQFIPGDASAVIKIKELNDFISSAENNAILNNIVEKNIRQASTLLKNLNSRGDVYISFNDNQDYLILAENDSSLFVLDSIKNIVSETLVKFEIEKTKVDTTIIYHKTIGNVFAGSNNLELVKALDIKNENTLLSQLIETTDQNSITSLIFKSGSKDYSKLLFTNTNNTSRNYNVLDLNYNGNNLNYNGIIKSVDSSSKVLNAFRNTIPQKINTPAIAPRQTGSLISLTYNDISILNKNLSIINGQNIGDTQTFLNFTNEIALVDKALILHTLDPNLALETIENKSISETFRSIDIFEFEQVDFFKTQFLPFIAFENAKYFSIYENFMIFSSSIQTIETILTDALNNNTLAESEAFSTISENLSDAASLFIFKNAEGLSEILDKNLNGYNANAVQYIYENNYAHINGVIQKFKKRAQSNTVTEAFSTKIKATILSEPQTLKNHVTDAHDIAVQDVNNKLYLISNSGSILWEKQLKGKILGEIEQIDIYKNGRLQLVFATPNHMYVLDRNGNDVSSFPKKFNDAITQPISVFDYDATKNYRIAITQGKNILIYDSNGKIIKGFDYNSNGPKITTQPKHFKIGSKDFIVFAAGERLMILNRQGKTRIKVDDKIRFSSNSIYLYKNKFTFTNTLGQLIQIDTKGKLTSTDLKLTDKHNIETTSKTLVTMVENKLKIKSRTVNLDYGDYTAPKVFYINDKIYITTTDLQSKKVYLFDSQAKSIPNFPVFGTTSADLQKLDNSPGLELITQSDEKNLIVYKIN